MNPLTSSAFALPERLAAKADPALIAEDERHFAAVAESLKASIAETSRLLDAELKAPGGSGQAAMDRDIEVHRLGGRLRTLRRFGLDLCLGRMVTDEGNVYVGRLGLTGEDGQRLLIDWRSPAAEPFFAATHANPMGLVSRRRYRWHGGRVGDYWDEVFTSDGLEQGVALDDQSAFVASLGTNRSERMRDVLATIQADQDAIIRAGSRGALVVDGGPGTGKTVVALHRTAHLLYADPRLGHRRGGVLFVGPHRPYLDYVSDVLPSLGEEGVQTCIVRDLVAEGAAAKPEGDPEVARLKESARLVKAVERAVRFYEEPPAEGMTLALDRVLLPLTAADWAEAFDAPEPGTPHNEGREEVWAKLVEILWDKYEGDLTPQLFQRLLRQIEPLTSALSQAWPLIEAAELVGDLWTVPAYLRLAAPWLAPDDVRRLQRAVAGHPGAHTRARPVRARPLGRRPRVDELLRGGGAGEPGGAVLVRPGPLVAGRAPGERRRRPPGPRLQPQHGAVHGRAGRRPRARRPSRRGRARGPARPGAAGPRPVVPDPGDAGRHRARAAAAPQDGGRLGVPGATGAAPEGAVTRAGGLAASRARVPRMTGRSRGTYERCPRSFQLSIAGCP
nr:hypothetical protein [Streptomyces acidiscabies]